jgi:hypothetical protein
VQIDKGAMMSDSKSNIRQNMAAILPGVLKERGWQTQIELHSIFLNWSKVVDDETAAHGQPLKIVKGTLWVEVENSAWLQQLQYRKVALLRSINSFLPGEKIKGLRFVLPQPDRPLGAETVKIRFVPPLPEALRGFEEQAACIEDKETREALVRLWYLAKACVRE